jgi:signal peptidase I
MIILESIKKRNFFLAGLLSLLTFGLGQVYNGQLKKGIIFFISSLIINISILVGILNTFYGLIALVVIGIILYLWNVIDAIINASKAKNYSMKSFNRWYIYIIVVILMNILNCVSSPLLPVKCYKPVGKSMFPTIDEGERILVNKTYYQNHRPSRGDVLIFTRSNKSYIKRVIAVGGEKLEINGSKILINGKEIKNTRINNIGNGTATNLQKPMIYDIPKDTVFVLGDNFEQSKDSREFGPIKLKSIKGKVLYICWSKNNKKIGKAI